MEKRELTCIGCPLGCQITVTLNNGEVIEVKGNTCNRGLNYAKKEVTAPERTFTGSIKIIGGTIAKVSVKTDKEVPKEKMIKVAEKVKTITTKAPIHIGDIIVNKILGTDANLVATKTVLKK